MENQGMIIRFISSIFIITMVSLNFACKSYKNHIMFTSDQELIPSKAAEDIRAAEESYIVQPNDKIKVRVYTSKGERIIDPEFELFDENTSRFESNKYYPEYLVDQAGMVLLPMVGEIKIGGYTKLELDSALSEAYKKFYQDPYVISTFSNKRVIVLGAPGGQVIPINDEGMHILEVLALAGGVNKDAKAQNIKLIRGDIYNNPEVFRIDLSTLDGLKKSTMKVMPGDIIYVEPVVRAFAKSSRELAPFVAILTNIASITVLIITLTNTN